MAVQLLKPSQAVSDTAGRAREKSLNSLAAKRTLEHAERMQAYKNVWASTSVAQAQIKTHECTH
eukprot:270939-Pleurochrysis_carterae.AAC.2